MPDTLTEKIPGTNIPTPGAENAFRDIAQYFDVIPASLMRHIGSEHWYTPWVYAVEAGSFLIPYFTEDDSIAWRRVGDNRGVNLVVTDIPALTEGYDFIPGVSEVFLIHSKAMALWNGGVQALHDMLFALSTLDFQGKEAAEQEAMLTYADAYRLVVEHGLSTDEHMAFGYQVDHLLYMAAMADTDGWTKVYGLRFKAGVFCYTPLATRPFVQYAPLGEKVEVENPLITVAYITDDPDAVFDPTGHTQEAPNV